MTVKEWLLAYVGPYEPQIVTIGDLSLVGPDWAYVCSVALLCVLMICFFSLAKLLLRGVCR